MKVLFLMRLYTHLTPAITRGKWEPMGMPAFCKLVEGMNRRGIDTDVLLLSRNPVEQIKEIQTLTFKQLSNVQFYVAPFKSSLVDMIDPVHINHLHLFLAWKLVRKNRYDLIYCDRVHVAYGALFAWLRKKVVLRLYGVANLPKAVKAFRYRMIPSLQYLSFRAPFSSVICTRDGSPGKHFINEHIRDTVPAELLLNGVDPLPEKVSLYENLRRRYRLSPDTKIILSTGRIASDKASDVFIRAIIELKKRDDNFFVVMVGEGPLRSNLEEQVMQHNLSHRVEFTGRVPHHQVYDYLAQADIYVSLNLYGNLSNAVLEAMNAGKCIVTLKKCEASHRDEQLENLELRDALVLVDRDKIVDELPFVLDELIRNPEKIRMKGKKMRRYAEKTIKSWDERINYEIDFLCKLAGK